MPSTPQDTAGHSYADRTDSGDRAHDGPSQLGLDMPSTDPQPHHENSPSDSLPHDSPQEADGDSGGGQAPQHDSPTGRRRPSGKPAARRTRRPKGNKTATSSSGRDPEAAKQHISDALGHMMRQADAVERFHAASDRIDSSRAVIEEATAERNAALSEMRAAGMTIATMSKVTYLSTSYIRTCLNKGTSER